MRVRQSEHINELVAALVKVQGSLGVAVKNTSNKHLGNDYANLGAVIEASREPLSQNGLALTQTPYTGDDGAMYVETMLAHVSGQFKAGDMRVPVVAQKGLSEAQSLGSALTYVMRYARKAVLGITDGYEDDDGNAAGRADDTEPSGQRPPPPARREPAPVDDVPFMVGPNDAEAMARSPAPQREPHPDAEIVKGVVAGIFNAASVAAVRTVVNDAESLPITGRGRTVILLAAGQRMIGVAATPKELAEVGEFLKQLRDSGAGDEVWHAGAGKAYKARRAALTAVAS